VKTRSGETGEGNGGAAAGGWSLEGAFCDLPSSVPLVIIPLASPLPTPSVPPPLFAALAKAAGSPISFPSKRQQQPHSGGTLVNSHLPPPPCGTNATPGEPVYETRKSRGRAPRPAGRGRRMRWRTKGTRRGRAQRAGRRGPENGNGTALRHSDTRARVKWRRESEKWSARGARSVIGGASTRSAWLPSSLFSGCSIAFVCSQKKKKKKNEKARVAVTLVGCRDWRLSTRLRTRQRTTLLRGSRIPRSAQKVPIAGCDRPGRRRRSESGSASGEPTAIEEAEIPLTPPTRMIWESQYELGFRPRWTPVKSEHF